MKNYRPTIRRLVIGLTVTVLVVVLLTLGLANVVLNTESGTRWALQRGLQFVNNLPGQSIAFSSVEGSLVSGLSLQNVEYQGPTVRLTSGQVRISWDPYTLLTNRVLIQDLSLTDASVNILQRETPRDPADAARPLPDLVALPVAIDINQASITNLSVVAANPVFALNSARFSARLENSELTFTDLTLAFEPFSVDGDLTLGLRGFLPVAGELAWRYSGDPVLEYTEFAGNVTASGSLRELELSNRLRVPEAVDSTGSLTTGLFGIPLGFDLEHRASALVLPYEQTASLQFRNVTLATRGSPADLALSLSTSLDVENFTTLQVSAEGDLASGSLSLRDVEIATGSGQLSGSGQLNLSRDVSGSFTYRLSDSQPLGYFPAELPLEVANFSSDGQISFAITDGVLDATLQFATVAGEFGDYPFQGNGTVGFRAGAFNVESLQLTTADNRLSFSGSYDNNANITWEIDARQLDQIIAELDGRLQASGQLSGDLSQPQLNATVLGEAIRYGGVALGGVQLDLAFSEESIQSHATVTQAELGSGDTAFLIESVVLDLSGTQARHRLTAAAQSELGSAELEITGSVRDLSTRAWSGELVRAALETPAGPWATQAAASIGYDGTRLSAAEQCWQQAPVALCFAVLGDLAGSSPGAEVTGTLRGFPAALFNRDYGLNSELPPLLANLPRLPQTVAVDGVVNGNYSLTLDSTGLVSAALDLQPDGLAITIIPAIPEDMVDFVTEDELRQTYRVLDPRLQARLTDGTWNLTASLRAAGTGMTGPSQGFEGIFDSSLQLDSERRIDGEMRTSLDSISWVAAFVPDLANVQGRVNGTIRVAGTLDSPQLAIDMALQEGRFNVLPLGIEVTSVAGSVKSAQSDQIDFEASARSDQGNLALTGRILSPFSDQAQAEARLAGEQFRLADIPDLNVSLSPDLTVKASRELIELNGLLFIPVLTINLRELPETAVDVSRDTVIVSYPPDQPELAQSAATERGTFFSIPVAADVDISLGDQVNFNGFGLTSKVDGDLNVQQRANGTNLTYGELEIVEGTYTLYGRSLQIRQGKLLFFGAYDNPALDIRAVREVGDTTVGVLMNGTLKNINSQLFSTPTLADSDIIAIMVTGRPFSETGQQDGDAMVGAIASLGLSRSQGLTNQVREQLGLDTLAITNTGNFNNSELTIGKYLTPDLFIRYGIGLFDHQSKLALDYTLTERITLQAETGEYQSVDVIYRVER